MLTSLHLQSELDDQLRLDTQLQIAKCDINITSILESYSLKTIFLMAQESLLFKPKRKTFFRIIHFSQMLLLFSKGSSSLGFQLHADIKLRVCKLQYSLDSLKLQPKQWIYMACNSGFQVLARISLKRRSYQVLSDSFIIQV